MSGYVAISILIPAWNEEESIGRVVRGSLAVCRDAGFRVECLVCVDSRTADDTARVARDAGARVIAQQGRGLTAAVLEVAELAAGGVCVVLDGDGQHDARRVLELAAPVLAGEADLVTGARDPGSLASGFGCGWRGRLRRGGGRLMGFAARIALRRTVPDPLTGMFACHRSELLRLRQRTMMAPPRGYKLLLGLLAATPPRRAHHIEVPFLSRRGGDSKLDARVVLTTVRQLLGIALARRPVASESNR